MDTNTTLPMFRAVSEMNIAYGNPQGDRNNINWDKLRKQCENIGDELVELLAALDARDITGVRDALCDINVFSLGGHHIAGFDADEDMSAVYNSNMSKFCADEEELEATKAKYAELGVPFYVEGEFPTVCLKAKEDFTDAGGNQYRRGKFLKGIAYAPPVFE